MLHKKDQGVLYVVATPIGNLEDLSFRAVRVLKDVDLIAAEDTRYSKRLLNHYDIKTPTISYYDAVEADKADEVINKLNEGLNVALISNAGTPTISDPGYRVIRKALQNDLNVVSVPGTSAHTAALSVSGLPTDRFIFEGFVPRKAGEKRRAFEALRDEPRTVIFYESPHRIEKTMDTLADLFPEREVCVCRELTKIYEEVIKGTAREVAETVKRRKPIKGEITIIIAGEKKRKAKECAEVST
jgi:16S rRNA (cytidine1402-2'-O)-methyltransferase